MVKTIVVLEDGKITHTIDENDWDGVEVKDGKLISKAEKDGEPQNAPEPPAFAWQARPAEPPQAASAAARPAGGESSLPTDPAAERSADAEPWAAPKYERPDATYGQPADPWPSPYPEQGQAPPQAPPSYGWRQTGYGVPTPDAANAGAGTGAESGLNVGGAASDAANTGGLAPDSMNAGGFAPDPMGAGGGFSPWASGAEGPAPVGGGGEPAFAGARPTNGPDGVRPMYEWRDPSQQSAQTPPKTRRLRLNRAVSVVLIVLLSASAGFCGGLAASGLAPRGLSPISAAQSITITPSEQVSTTEAVAAKVIPSVVGVTSSATRRYDNFFFGAYNQEVSGVGTGIIVDAGGYILTNSHVVMDGAVDDITVLLPDSREVAGTVLWNDANLDLALLKVEASDLVAADLGDSDVIKIGAYVAAIGNPLGLDFRSSVSSGVISGLDRSIVVGDGSNASRPVQMEGLMQVDAAINSGNSGGPLVNQKGEVIGINTAKAQSGEGMGFAIPINVAKPIVESVKATGEFHRVYIGITPNDVTALLSAYPHLDFGVDKGAFVDSVTPGSPAERAGLRRNDVITELNGKEVRSSTDLIKQLLGYKSGDEVTLTVVRDKKPMSVAVTLTDSLNPQS
ncbi:MAG: trypsin-like peptidase domain-containing protein [Clostridiales Family XIII bacterium]|nr:trypsin-like peptidase domain-containing protein [Clostridiales Family XIII bacterium]